MKILMVCLGNICRSPLAEGIMQHRAEAEGLEWKVDSAGTGYWHAGEAPDRRSILVARRFGIDISKQRARQIQADDFELFDRIFVMDRNNLRDVLRLAKTETHREKVGLMLDCSFPGENREVPDPYYDDEEGFEQVYKMLDKACRAFIRNHTV